MPTSNHQPKPKPVKPWRIYLPLVIITVFAMFFAYLTAWMSDFSNKQASSASETTHTASLNRSFFNRFPPLGYTYPPVFAPGDD